MKFYNKKRAFYRRTERIHDMYDDDDENDEEFTADSTCYCYTCTKYTLSLG